jgi:hypothetical protein
MYSWYSKPICIGGPDGVWPAGSHTLREEDAVIVLLAGALLAEMKYNVQVSHERCKTDSETEVGSKRDGCGRDSLSRTP